MPAATLVGRDAELRVLGEQIDGASEVGAVLLLPGEPGVGRPELVSPVADTGRAAGRDRRASRRRDDVGEDRLGADPGVV
jgi:hypothetical protein